MNQPIKILIVEDELIPAEFLKALLEQKGYDVADICTKGEEAVQVAQYLKPDIIFMDIMLKDKMSGCEAALKLSSLIDTKIIFLTAYFSQEMLDYALEAKAVNYLLKPYREKQIFAALEMALGHTGSTHSPAADDQKVMLPCKYFYNIEKQRLFREDKEVNISNKSLQLVHYLVLHIDTAVSKEELARYIYGEASNTSTVRTLIFRLRKQLKCNMVQNVSGLGYKIVSALRS